MDTAGLFSLVGMGLVAAVLAVTMRADAPAFATLLSVGAGVLILAGVVAGAAPVFEQVRAIFQSAGLPGAYLQILFRALGICFVTQIACDACADAGERAIGAKVELAGKVAVMVVSLPLFSQVMSIVRELI